MNSAKRFLPLIFLTLIMLLVLFIRLRLLSFPLERDEGEYAYFGQLILQGVPPYTLAYNLKMPGTYYSYAMIMAAFGQSAQGIHLGLLVLSLASIVLVFAISRVLFNDIVGLSAAAAFGLISVSPTLLGQAAHANHFVTLYMLAGFYFLLRAAKKGRLPYCFAAGVFMGMAFLAKQPGFFFCVFGAVILIPLFGGGREGRWRRLAPFLSAYGIGVASPILLVLLTTWLAGAFDRFWFWTVQYPQVYGSRIPVTGAWSVFKTNFPPVASAFTALWIMAGLGVTGLSFYLGKSKSRTIAGVFVFFSIMTVMPGFVFRSHYFLPLVPALGLMVGICLETINKRIRYRHVSVVTAAGFVIVVFSGLYANRAFFFETDPVELCRDLYPGNPFAESVPIADYIRQNTAEDDKILIFGSEPQICFYSRRQSATGYIYMYDLVYEHKYRAQMQSEMIRQVEVNKPKIIVYVSASASWLAQGSAASPLFRWLGRYLPQYRYIPICYADVLFPRPTVYAWGDEARRYRRQSENCVIVFNREIE